LPPLKNGDKSPTTNKARFLCKGPLKRMGKVDHEKPIVDPDPGGRRVGGADPDSGR
jgi:hypothetical protein